MILNWLPSRRKKIENGTLYPDVYQYDEVSEKLRLSIARIFRKAKIPHENLCDFIETICDEWGMDLDNKLGYGYGSFDDIEQFILNSSSSEIEKFLDLLALHVNYLYHNGQKNLIQELNQRMLENGFGYQFENNTLICIDSLPMHQKVVKPTLKLLQDSRFENANAEYCQAFNDYNHRKYESMFLNLCNSAESTIKIICNINGFALPKNLSLSSLTETLKQNDFLPNYSTESLNGLAKVVNTIGNLRNNNGGHGAGAKKREFDQSFVSYAMHSTASTLLFLLQRQKEWESK